MRHKGPKNWNRDPALLGTIRIRKTKCRDGVRFIKVTYRGPKQGHWKPLARHWWETNNGPVPAGLRVVHANGNTLDDRPENYTLMSGGQLALLYRRTRDGVQQKMETRRAKATAETNRLRGQIRRATHWLPTRWYAVDPVLRLIFNHPRRQRHQLLQLCGLAVDSTNWRRARTILAQSQLHLLIVRGRELLADEYRTFTRTDDLPTLHAALNQPAESRRRHSLAEGLAQLASAVAQSREAA